MAEKGESSEAARKKKRLSLSLKRRKEGNSASPLKKRFAKTSDQEMQSLKVKPMSKNTERSQRWALNVFKEWVRSNDWPEVEVERLWNEADSKKVCEMLCRFIVEAKQRSGEPYCPKTLLQLLINLQSYAGSQNPTASNFLDTDDQVFKPLHHVLNNHSKKLLTDGVGAKKKQARVVTSQEEETLWDKGVMGTHSPTSLQNAIFFYCGVCFCLRGGVEHRYLKLNQFEIEEVPHPTTEGETIRCVTYAEHGSKNRQGFVHQVHLENKVVTQYANPSLGERCFVNLFERYVSLLPEDAKGRNLFYCKPKKTISKEDTSWYFNIPVGHNVLSRRLKDMFIAAGLDSTGINNHGLRASGITRMYVGGVPEKMIMERSGHLSIGGVRSYERTTDAQRMEVSKVLSSTNAMKTASSQCEETDTSTSKLATLQSIEKLPLPSGEDKENKMFNFQNLTGCTINFNIL